MKGFFIGFAFVAVFYLLLSEFAFDISTNGFVIGTIIFIVLIILMINFFMKKIAGVGLFDKNKSEKLTKKFIKSEDIPNGKLAIATIISSQQGGMVVSIYAKKYYQLLIEVNVRNKNETWQATIKHMTPINQLGMYQPGLKMKVIYDPNDKSKVVLDQNNTKLGGNNPLNMGAGLSYTHQDLVDAQQAAPPDLMQRVQLDSALLDELNIVGADSIAEIVGCEIVYKDFMPDINILKVTILVKGTSIDPFEKEMFMISPKSSLHKLENGKTVFVKYDTKNPRRVAISGLDKQNSTIKI